MVPHSQKRKPLFLRRSGSPFSPWLPSSARPSPPRSFPPRSRGRTAILPFKSTHRRPEGYLPAFSLRTLPPFLSLDSPTLLGGAFSSCRLLLGSKGLLKVFHVLEFLKRPSLSFLFPLSLLKENGVSSFGGSAGQSPLIEMAAFRGTHWPHPPLSPLSAP